MPKVYPMGPLTWREKIFGRKGIDYAFTPQSMDDRGVNDLFADIWQTQKSPSKFKLVEQYKAICYACANINAHRMASVKLRFYYRQSPDNSIDPNFKLKALSPAQKCHLITKDGEVGSIVKGMSIQDIQEVVDHPAKRLLEAPNPHMTFFELMEFTDLYQEFVGNAFWYLVRSSPQALPTAIWMLPSQNVRTIRGYAGEPLIRYYEFGAQKQKFETWEILPFKFPNLKDPYLEGWSPARGIWESIELMGKQSALSNIHMDNRGRPDILISPKDMMGPAEAKRLRLDFFKRFRRGGNGGVLVMENAFDIKNLAFSPKDLEMLAFYKVGKIEIANGYGVPLSLLETEDVNRANAEAGHYQHAKLAIEPRCLRQEGRLSRFYCSLWDPSGNFFCAYDNCVPEDQVLKNEVRKTNLETGKNIINEIRREEHEPPVAWGDKPWLPLNLAQPSEDEKLNERQDMSKGHDPNGDNMKPNPSTNDKEKLDKKKILGLVVEYYQGKLTQFQAAEALLAGGAGMKFTAKALATPNLIVANAPMPLPLEGGSTGYELEQYLKGMFARQREGVLESLKDCDPHRDTRWCFLEHGVGDELHLAEYMVDLSPQESIDAIKRATGELLRKTNLTTTTLLQDAWARVSERKGATGNTLESTVELIKHVKVVFDHAINDRAERTARTEARKVKLIAAK